MKFLICGNLDAPDWILKEIEVLSKMSAVKFKLLCSEIVRILCGEEVDYEKLQKHCAGYDASSTKAIVAAVTFMLKNSAKYNVKPEVASVELQQLGLPKRHATDIEKLLQTDGAKLREKFKTNIMTLNRLDSMDWRVDFVLSSSTMAQVNEPTVQLSFNVKALSSKNAPGGVECYSLGVDAQKLRVLLHELKAAKEIMKGL